MPDSHDEALHEQLRQIRAELRTTRRWVVVLTGFAALPYVAPQVAAWLVQVSGQAWGASEPSNFAPLFAIVVLVVVAAAVLGNRYAARNPGKADAPAHES